jgi:hypothetical protein
MTFEIREYLRSIGSKGGKARKDSPAAKEAARKAGIAAVGFEEKTAALN